MGSLAGSGLNGVKRGALICLEGCDKAGKSTHSKLLIDSLKEHGRPSHLINFPDRTTEIGKMIDAYLKCHKEIKDEAIHLLFSANRWELVPKIKEYLEKGETVIMDRYAFSGVAFSAAKGTVDLDWCMSPDVGLPRPDQVMFLTVPESEAENRGNFGEERYEVVEFQRKVKNVFLELKDDSYWKVIETNRPKNEVQQEIVKLALKTIIECEDKPILPLWKKVSYNKDEASVKKTNEDIHTTV